MLKVGDKLPYAAFTTMGEEGLSIRTTTDIFAGRSVALFAVPGAYTPVCHRQHLPGIIALVDDLHHRGIDTIACTAVNDIFVMERWSEDLGNDGRVVMLADGNAEFALKSDLAVDLSKYGLGVRSNRYVMLVADGTVRLISVEDVLMRHEKSSASLLCQLMDQEKRF
jgi:glutaredoxin/glutathione-dependent peroxiredoxin